MPLGQPIPTPINSKELCGVGIPEGIHHPQIQLFQWTALALGSGFFVAVESNSHRKAKNLATKFQNMNMFLLSKNALKSKKRNTQLTKVSFKGLYIDHRFQLQLPPLQDLNSNKKKCPPFNRAHSL